MVARAANLTWPLAFATGPAPTHGVVALAIVPVAVLALSGTAWWLLEAPCQPAHRRRSDLLSLPGIGVPSVLVLPIRGSPRCCTH